MVQIETTAANDNLSPSLSGKGELFDAAEKMDQLAPAVQKQIDATEGIFERFGIQINLGKPFNPSESVQILDMRRNPEEYVDTEALPMLKRVQSLSLTNDNVDSNKPLQVVNR